MDYVDSDTFWNRMSFLTFGFVLFSLIDYLKVDFSILWVLMFVILLIGCIILLIQK